MKKILFEKDQFGLTLPTLRNKDTVNKLIKSYGSKSNIPRFLQKDVDCFFIQWALWKDTDGNTDWYSTEEGAIRAHQAMILTARLDIKYLEDKKS